MTVTGSDDIAVAPHAGVAVSGGPNVLATDAGETIQFSFNSGAAIDVSYINNNVGGFPGSGVGFGAAIVEGFGVGGASLGTFEGCCFGIIDVSTPFGNVPLSRFTATGIVPVGGEPSFFRTGSLTYTPVDPPVPSVSCVGFESPMNGGPVKVKKNRALPHKAQLLDESESPLNDLDIAAAPVIQVVYDNGVLPAEDVSGDALSAGAGTDGNQFEFLDSKWQFNLKTRNYTGAGTYTTTMVSGDEAEYLIDPTCEATFVIK